MIPLERLNALNLSYSNYIWRNFLISYQLLTARIGVFSLLLLIYFVASILNLRWWVESLRSCYRKKNSRFVGYVNRTIFFSSSFSQLESAHYSMIFLGIEDYLTFLNILSGWDELRKYRKELKQQNSSQVIDSWDNKTENECWLARNIHKKKSDLSQGCVALPVHFFITKKAQLELIHCLSNMFTLSFFELITRCSVEFTYPHIKIIWILI